MLILYRNVIFDLGGVVVNYSPKDFLVDMFFHEATEQKIFDAVFGSEEWLLMDRGSITWLEASDIFMERGKKLGLELEMQAVLDDWLGMLTNRRATINLMNILKKKGFNLYYLSNVSSLALDMLSKRDFWQLFDGGVASCEVGLLKPEQEMYKKLLDKYSLNAQESIFTDDHKDNALAAFQVGITGIQFKTVKNFIKMLVTYGIDM